MVDPSIGTAAGSVSCLELTTPHSLIIGGIEANLR